MTTRVKESAAGDDKAGDRGRRSDEMRSRRTYFGLAVVASLTVACGATPTNNGSLVVGISPPPNDEIAANCSLAAKKCTRCHTIERLLHARVATPTHWERYVHRMRLMPGSGISQADEKRIVSCLVFRSFGSTTANAVATPGELK